MQAENVHSDEYALQRVFDAADPRTQVELAEFLGIRQSSISDAKKRRSIPADWLIVFLLRKGVHPKWVLTGTGSRYLQPSEIPTAAQPDSIDIHSLLRLCPASQLAAELVRRWGERDEGGGNSGSSFVSRTVRGKKSPQTIKY